MNLLLEENERLDSRDFLKQIDHQKEVQKSNIYIWLDNVEKWRRRRKKKIQPFSLCAEIVSKIIWILAPSCLSGDNFVSHIISLLSQMAIAGFSFSPLSGEIEKRLSALVFVETKKDVCG